MPHRSGQGGHEKSQYPGRLLGKGGGREWNLRICHRDEDIGAQLVTSTGRQGDASSACSHVVVEHQLDVNRFGDRASRRVGRVRVTVGGTITVIFRVS